MVFPQPDSPTSPSRSPSAQLEPDSLDGVQLAAALEVEPDVEVLDPEQGRAHSESSAPFSGAAAAGSGGRRGGRRAGAG